MRGSHHRCHGKKITLPLASCDSLGQTSRHCQRLLLLLSPTPLPLRMSPWIQPVHRQSPLHTDLSNRIHTSDAILLVHSRAVSPLDANQYDVSGRSVR